MKKLLFFIALFGINISNAQNGFNYKALIINNSNALANQAITIKFTVLQNGTTSVYQETQATTTDTNGIVSVQIGEGIQVSGDFNTIDFSMPQSLKVEINTGNGYIDFGTSELKSVPYAKYADKAGNTFSGNWSDLNGVPSDLFNDTFYVTGTTNRSAIINSNIYHTGKLAIGTTSSDALTPEKFVVKTQKTIIKLGNDANNSQAIMVSSNLQGGNTISAKQNNTNNSISKSVLHAEYLTDKVVSDVAYYVKDNVGYDSGYYGIYNKMKPGDNPVYGIRNDIEVATNDINNISVGSFNLITGSGNTSIAGSSCAIANTGSGVHYGNYISFRGGDGNRYGSKIYFGTSGDGDHIGYQTYNTSNGTGKHYGAMHILGGHGIGFQIGTMDSITNASNAMLTGKYSSISGTGKGMHTGSFNELSNGTGYEVGVFNNLMTSTDSIAVGNMNLISSTGTGDRVGVNNYMIINGTGETRAVLNEIENYTTNPSVGVENKILGSGAITGMHNILKSNGAGDVTGTLNSLEGTNTATLMCERNVIEATSTGGGNKYASYNYIPQATGGLHYAVYASAPGANNYAGFFNGNIKITGNVKGKIKSSTSGDADMKAYIYGKIYSIGSKDAGASSSGYTISHTANTGIYRITFSNSPGSAHAYMAVASMYSVPGFILAYNSGSYFEVHTYNTSGTHADADFNFVVYKK